MKCLVLPLFVALAGCSTAPGPVAHATPVERQMVGFLQKFDRWDEDGDGYLTALNLKKAEQITGHPPEKIVEFYDSNHDKKISLAEAQAGLKRFDEAEAAAREKP